LGKALAAFKRYKDSEGDFNYHRKVQGRVIGSCFFVKRKGWNGNGVENERVILE
jgi:hypothetical protein